jgi:hypothetical protein
MKKLLAIAALGACLATPALADFTVIGGTTQPLPILGNDFNADLAALGFDTEGVGSGLSVLPGDKVEFYAFGSESSFFDSFVVNGVTLFSETDSGKTYYDSSVALGGEIYGTGTILDLLFDVDNDFGSGVGINATIDQSGFAIIYNAAATGDWVALAFDDNGAGPDDNHDDLIILAHAVPEPTTWALMIAAFGMLGWSVRRRTVTA